MLESYGVLSTRWLWGLVVVMVILAGGVTGYELRYRYCHQEYMGPFLVCGMGIKSPRDFDVIDPAVVRRWEEWCRLAYADEGAGEIDFLSEMLQGSQTKSWKGLDSGGRSKRERRIEVRGSSASLYAEALSADGQFRVRYEMSSRPAFRSLHLEVIDPVTSEVDYSRVLDFSEIGYWRGMHWPENYLYDMHFGLPGFLEMIPEESGRGWTDLDWGLHKHRLVDAETFVRTSLQSIDELEEGVKGYLVSDEPRRISVRYETRVDLIRCDCEHDEFAGDRVLAEAERHQIIETLDVEMERRRDLIRRYGERWFELLEGILVGD
ncbi:hypothetical protein [Lacunimicrobium album]